MAIKKLREINFKDKVVFLRTDINSDIVNGKVVESARIKPACETISYLLRKKAKVIVIAHQGNPGKSDFSSLRNHVRFLKKYIKIKFIKDVIGKNSENAINLLKPGQAVLLENIRFINDEFHPEKKNNKLIKFFVPKIDIYVNDAFSVCHRKHTSITEFSKYKPSCDGLILEKEINSLKKISIKNCLYILAGAKPEENIKLLRNRRKILAAGIFGQMCLEAGGIKLGKNNEKENRSVVKNYFPALDKLKKTIKYCNCKILTPVDYAVEIDKKREEIRLEEFPTKYIVYDIGERTQERFIQEIKKAKAVYMKGPVGFAGKKYFAKGTFNILKAKHRIAVH